MIEFNEPIDLLQVNYDYHLNRNKIEIFISNWLPETIQVTRNDNVFARLFGRTPYIQTHENPYGKLKKTFLTIPEAINYKKPEGCEFVKFSLDPENHRIRIFYRKSL
jgi:hypothetical protein